jgi:putative ABC transport system permease protein
MAMLRTGVRDLVRRPLQTSLMILGIALGVAVVVSIDLANTSARKAFGLSTQAVIGKATHLLTGGPQGLPDDLYRQLRLEWGISQAAPLASGRGLIPGAGVSVQLLGIDPISDQSFRSLISAGLAGQAAFSSFFTDPRAVLLPAKLAQRLKLNPGDDFKLEASGQLHTVHLLGVMQPSEASAASALGDVVLADVATIQELLGMPDRLTRIDLILTPGQAESLQSRLPPGVQLLPASQQSETAAQMTSAFELNLTALSLLALIVGIFLIYNTMMFSVVRRRQVLGTLRALGATAWQVFGMVLAEAALVAAIGSVLGLGFGWLLGQGAVRLVARTINDLYFTVSVTQTELAWSTVGKGISLGLLAGLIGAAFPAREAARADPVEALRRSPVEDRARSLAPRMAAAGLVLSGLGGVLLAETSRSLVGSYAGLFAMLLGLALAVPILTIGLMRLSAGVLRKPSPLLGPLAARTVMRALSRTSVAIAALMMALSVTIGVGVMISSFRETVINWLTLTLQADLYVTAQSENSSRPTASFSPDIASQLAALPGIAEAEAFRAVEVQSSKGAIALSVSDVRRQRSNELYRFAAGTARQVWQQVLDGAVVVSEPFAYRYNIPPAGGTVILRTDRGQHIFPVVGIYYDYSTDRGTVLMSENIYHQYWDDRSISSIGLILQPQAAEADVLTEVRQALQGTGLEVQANHSLRLKALQIFDQTFAITAALRLLTFVVAFIGILSALLTLQLERTRELATLRALGMTMGDIAKLTLLESGLMGGAAGLLAWPTGLLLAEVLINVINLRSFGWTIRTQLSPSIFLLALLVGIGAALVGAVYPLHRLRRLSVSEALRDL